MKKKKILTIGICSIIALGSLVYAADDISINSLITTQGIDLKITSKVDDSLFSAGKKISYSPVIENNGIPAYVRFKTEILQSNLPPDSFYGLSEDWIQKGEYMYYTKPLNHNEKVSTYQGFQVPVYWDNEDTGEIENLKVCDAIQSDNFEPDFTKDEPWGNVAVVESDYDGASYVNTVNKIEPYLLNIKQSSDIELSSDDILNFTLRPGDVISNHIELSNNANNPMKIDFKTEAEDNRLLESLGLKLYLGDNKIYDGNLKAEEFSLYKEITELKTSEKSNLTYEISVPTDLDNSYQENKGEFTWSFKTTEITPKGQVIDTVKTGDNMPLCGTIIVLLLAGIGIVYAIFKRKKNSNEK